MWKRMIIEASVCLVSGFVGKLAYECSSKPDGYLYLDKETKKVYAVLNKDPDKYKNGSRLVFIFKA